MKVNIITKHSSYNFGAMLQAYALHKTMTELGADCNMIDLRQPKPATVLPMTSPQNIIKTALFYLHKEEILRGHKNYELFINDRYKKTGTYYNDWELYDKVPEADVYITGSDQVWSPLKISDAFYLGFAPEKAIKASYAASLGISYMPEGAKQALKEYLTGMDYISVREESGKALLKDLTDKEINVNIDPVFLLSENEWKEVGVEPKIKKPYILCYVLYRTKWLNKWLRQLHKATGKDIVVVTVDAFRAIYNNKMIRDAGPCEFLGLLQNADFVVSSSFHGVALSIVNNKPFYAVVNPDMPSRIDNILDVTGLSDRIINENSTHELKAIDFTKANEIIAQERAKSLNYLKMLISSPEKSEKKIAKDTRLQGNISVVGDKCTACGVCEKVCPTKAIKMVKDKNGFTYPVIYEEKCINCGLCINKCHTQKHPDSTLKTSKPYYGWHKNEIVRQMSTSGGAFTAIAEKILSKNGLVAAVYYDDVNKKVVHATSDEIDMDKFRKSKYVESEMGDVLYKIDDALKANRDVLFCGTPCQAAGVRRAFGNAEKLIICDFLCHGVPSAKVFKDYLELKERKSKKSIIDYQFRTKTFGWSQYGQKTVFDDNKEKETVLRCEWFYVATMLEDKFLRKSCYTCDKAFYHEADITIGDFWGVFKFKPEINDNKGISLLISNTHKGKEMLESIKDNFELNEVEKKYIDYALRVKTSDKKLINYDKVFDEYNELGCEEYINKKYKIKMLKNKMIFMLNKKKYKRR